VEAILLSIKPEYSELIFAGIKLYEFRKRMPKITPKKIVVYATSPTMEVLGEIEVKGLIVGSPTKVWEMTKKDAGISRSQYRDYFKGCKMAFAFELGQINKYNPPKSLIDFGITNPPQSFVYLDE
jgi:predicted transcriptional regulator